MEPNEYLQILIEKSMDLLSKGRTINTLNPTPEEIKEYFQFYNEMLSLKMYTEFITNLQVSIN